MKQRKTSNLVFFAVLGLGLAGALIGMQVWGKKAKQADPPAIQAPVAPQGEVTGAYLQGGQPMREGPAREVFESALPDFVIALDSWGRGTATSETINEDMQEARAALVGAARKADLQDTIVERLEALIAACLLAASESDDKIDVAADAMIQTALRLNDAIASAGLGFFVDTELLTHQDGTRSVLLFSFEVLRVVLYRSAGHDVRTLRVRRLDNLNWSYSLLGFTTPQRRDAVVLDNKVDEHMLELLPALSNEFSMDPFHLSKEESYTPWFTKTRTLATAIIREELGTGGGPELAKLGALLARRSEIYANWNHELESREIEIRKPRSLAIAWDYRQQMEGLITHKAMDELDEIQKQLASKEMLDAFAAACDRFAQSVERHEAQHRLDLAELYKLPMPAELADYVGELPEGFHGKPGLRSTALAETSAYLSTLARDPLTPRLNLTLLTGSLLSERLWGTGESYAALVILEGLGKELGIEHSPIVEARRINRDTVAELYRELVTVETSALQSAAASLWARLFQTALPTLEVIAR